MACLYQYAALLFVETTTVDDHGVRRLDVLKAMLPQFTLAILDNIGIVRVIDPATSDIYQPFQF